MKEKISAEERQAAINELIQKHAISDQKQLVDLLFTHYRIRTNQAVVSRDLRRLNIAKKLLNGELIYEAAKLNIKAEILRLALIDISYNESLIVIKTHTGLAPFVGDCVDRCEDIGVLGCIAGENVVFVTPNSVKKIEKTYRDLCEQLYFKKDKTV